jgi:hypothetical protein
LAFDRVVWTMPEQKLHYYITKRYTNHEKL